MNAFFRHAALLFVALRAGDLVNLAAGLWFVPKYVAPDALGAVLPVTTFATCLALPAFAFAMTAMRETSLLARRSECGRLKSLLRGIFLATAALLILALILAALLLPRFLAAMRITDGAAGLLAVAAALTGCFAPVYTDALQALKRFRAYAAAEFLAAAGRLAVLAAAMPFRALAGYFAGNAAQPIVRIAVALAALRRDLNVPAEPFWNRTAVRRLALSFAAIFAYQLAPMLTSLAELATLRTALPTEISAGYFLATRLSDLLNYLTLPLLLVLFPYAADATDDPRAANRLARRCCTVTLVAATALALALSVWGQALLAWLPNGTRYAFMKPYLVPLVGIAALNACQVFFANAAVAAGRFGFLAWFVPLNLAYAVALTRLRTASLAELLAVFAAFAFLRLLPFGRRLIRP